MKKLKYLAIYAAGLVLFDFFAMYALNIAWTSANILWLGFAYSIANMAGDIERVARDGDRQ